MQNKATWLATLPEGYKVRVQFLPINPAEAETAKKLLMNADVKLLMVTTQGPLSADLLFTPKASPVTNPQAEPKPAVAVAPAGTAAAPASAPAGTAAAPASAPTTPATPSTQKTDKVQ